MKIYTLLFSILFMTLCNSLKGQELNLGDGVRLTFFNITDAISGDYFIQKDGNIQLPYIGLVYALDRNFENIKSEILVKYDSLYREPELTIQPLFKINVLGEVGDPGIYYVTGVERLVDVIAMAGGETRDANLDDIYIVRDDKEINIDAEQIMQEGYLVNDIGLRSGDRIYVPRKWWVSARNAGIIISAAAVIVTLISIFIR